MKKLILFLALAASAAIAQTYNASRFRTVPNGSDGGGVQWGDKANSGYTVTWLGPDTLGGSLTLKFGSMAGTGALCKDSLGIITVGSCGGGSSSNVFGVAPMDTPTNTQLQVTSNVGAVSTPTLLVIDGYSANGNGGGAVVFRAANGGYPSGPSALTAQQTIGMFGSRGYDGAQWVGSLTATIQFLAYENWNSFAHGTYIRFETTPRNSTTRGTRMYIDDAGLVPWSDNTYSLGLASARWNSLYSVNLGSVGMPVNDAYVTNFHCTGTGCPSGSWNGGTVGFSTTFNSTVTFNQTLTINTNSIYTPSGALGINQQISCLNGYFFSQLTFSAGLGVGWTCTQAPSGGGGGWNGGTVTSSILPNPSFNGSSGLDLGDASHVWRVLNVDTIYGGGSISAQTVSASYLMGIPVSGAGCRMMPPWNTPFPNGSSYYDATNDILYICKNGVPMPH